MEKNLERTPSRSDITIYQTEDGISKVEVLIEGETVWLTQEQMAILYGKSKSTICEHIRNIYDEKELVESHTMHKFGKTEFMDKGSNYYNLDVIIAVGYRVRSVQGTRFRQWATSTLKEYLITGVALNDERFKQGTSMNYFRQLLDRIREIRISEKVFYQQIKDIYKTSIDYDPSDEMTITFFKEVQNKLLWAVSEKTAAELIYFRANGQLPMMGLTSTEVPGKVLKRDIVIGKNYLNEDEMTQLKLIVEQFLAFAEAQAQAHRPMYMTDWISRLRMVLTMNEKNILEHSGRISHRMAVEKANTEYQIYNGRLLEEEHLKSIKELSENLATIGQ